MPKKTRKSVRKLKLPSSKPKGMFEESFFLIKNGVVQQQANVKGVITPEKILYEGEQNGQPLEGEIKLSPAKIKKSKKTKSKKRA